MTTATVERYRVVKTTHLGPIEREVRAGSVIEWNAAEQVMRIDGVQVGGPGSRPVEGMRTLIELSLKSPSAPLITLIGSEPVEGVERPSTKTLCVLPVIGCLQAAKEFLDLPEGDHFKAVNDEQQEFLDLFGERVDDAAFSLGELRRMAHRDASVVNAWLRENGFTIQLPSNGDREFSVASILDVLCEWLEKGDAITVGNDKGTFPAVRLKGDGVTILQNQGVHEYPVARLATKGGDRVCMTIVDGVPEGRFGLMSEIRALDNIKHEDYRHEGVIFPMVDYDRHEDISFMKGLEVEDTLWYVSEALQHTKFKMNEYGARVKSAAAMQLRCKSAGPSPMVIDRPFLLWVERDGLPMPLFAAVFAEDAWGNPGSLEDM